MDEVKGKGKDHEVRKRVQEEFWTTPFGLTFNKKEEVLTALNERTALLRVVRDAQQTAGIPNWGSGGPTKQVTARRRDPMPSGESHHYSSIFRGHCSLPWVC